MAQHNSHRTRPIVGQDPFQAGMVGNMHFQVPMRPAEAWSRNVKQSPSYSPNDPIDLSQPSLPLLFGLLSLFQCFPKLRI